MTKKEKLEGKIRRNPRNVSLDEFESLALIYGRIKMGAKHAKAVIGNQTITYKRVNPVPPEYVIDLMAMIDCLKGQK